jgi:hypothetical protein
MRPSAEGRQMLGFPLGSAIGGALIGTIGVPAMILTIARAYLALALLASGLRACPGTLPGAECYDPPAQDRGRDGPGRL